MDESINSKRNVRVGQLGWCRLEFVCSARRGGGGDPVTIRFTPSRINAPSSMPQNKNPLSARIIGLTKLLPTREESAS